MPRKLQGRAVDANSTITINNISFGNNVAVNTTVISLGNSTVNTYINSTSVTTTSLVGNGASVTSVDAATLGGNTASTLRSYTDTVAATAFSNAASRADAAYSNAIAYSGNATLAFANAAARADSAFANAAARADSAYSNAIAYSGNAALAFANAATRADNAYTNAVAYAASNSYVNSTFLPLAGGTMTGNLTINATANIVSNLSANNATFRGDVQIDGNLTVSGTSVVINATSLAVEDNMIYLNNGSQVSHPDLGFAGNYNDGSYKHAGFFRDATDGVWKVFDGYTLEPDASAYIDTSNVTFRIADFQANAITMASASLTGTITLKAISSNGSVGTAGQLLASNGTSTYWINPPASTNVDAQYTWTNNHTFNALITIANTLAVTRISANGALGTNGQVLSSNSTGGLYWGTGGGTTVIRNAYTGNGSNTIFTLGASSSNSSFTLVFVDNVFQPTTEFSVSGTTITFTAAPDNGVPIEVVQLGTSITDTNTVTGSNTHIQFNDSGSLGSNTLFAFNKTSTVLTIGNSTVNTAINTSSIAVTKVVANSSIGSDGQILTSNGAGVYWANAASTSKYSNQYLLTGTTTNATETEIFIDGGATRIPVAVNKTVYYTIDCVCRRTDSTGDHGAFFLKGVATNASGTTTDVGSIYEVIVTRSDANFAIDARANNASDSVNIFVTGATGKTVSWSCVVTTMEV
jgi:hypothetical protein